MRMIWYFTCLVVVVCAAILCKRGVREWARSSDTRTTPPVSRFSGTPVETMFALLEKDPQARRATTRAAVEAVAAHAENGTVRAGRDAGGPSKATAETYYALGVLRHGQGDNAAAEKAFRRAIELRPDWSWPYNGLGIVLFHGARTDEAEAMFRKASELDPDWSRPHNDLAVLFRFAKRWEEAEREALTALKLDPDNVATRNNYGNLLVVRNRMTEAEAEYRKAIALDPNHPTPYYNLACLSSRLGRKSEALEYLEKALTLDPSYVAEAQRDVDFQNIASDPAFGELLARVSHKP